MTKALGLNHIENAEHIDPGTSGDNIAAKKVAGYAWDGTNWNRSTGGSIFKLPYDSQYFTNPDAGGNYQTITSKLNGVTQETLTLTYDGNNNVTSIVRS